MTTLSSFEIHCPCCGNSYHTIGWVSTNSLGPFSTDLNCRASGDQPLPYEAHTCPSCGYTISRGEEFDVPPVSGDVKILVRHIITPIVKERHVQPWLKFEFTAWIAEWKEKTSYEIGFYYLKAAWCAGDCGKTDDEMYYRSQLITYFERELEHPNPGDKYDQAVLIYLIGENYRRLGKTEMAEAWLRKVPKAVRKEKKNYWLSKLAAQQRNDPKEFIEEGQFCYEDEPRTIVRWYNDIRQYYIMLLEKLP
jgi:uncharacterized protein (DUF2225 family)